MSICFNSLTSDENIISFLEKHVSALSKKKNENKNSTEIAKETARPFARGNVIELMEIEEENLTKQQAIEMITALKCKKCLHNTVSFDKVKLD